MELEFDVRRLGVAVLSAIALILLTLIALRIIRGGDDGGFDALDTSDTDNAAPIIDDRPEPVIETAVGQTIDPITIGAGDADGDPLTFSAIGLPPGITIGPTTGTITGAATGPCRCDVALVVDDGRGGTDEVRVLWTVTGDGDPATFDSTPPVVRIDGDVAAGPTVPSAPTSSSSSPTARSSTTARTTTASTNPPSTTTSIATTTTIAAGDNGNDDGNGNGNGSTSSTTAAPTTTTTTAPSTTTAPPTTAPSTTAAPGPASFQGVRAYDTFFQGRQQYDAWTAGEIAFYAPPGAVPREVGDRWMDWYVRVDAMYRVVSGRDNFDSVYRRNTPDLGRRKVLGIVETCGAGCGSKQQAEADPGYIPAMTGNPDDFAQHWIFFYEMGRGGSPEPWYGRATWPRNTVIIPHLMAGLAFYELGGEAGLRQGIPGDLLGELERWEAADLEYVDQFPIADQQSQNGYTSHHLMPAMLWRIRMETDLATVGRITANMATKPESASAREAMCDFRSAVNDATGGRFDGRMTGEWGLPDRC